MNNFAVTWSNNVIHEFLPGSTRFTITPSGPVLLTKRSTYTSSRKRSPMADSSTCIGDSFSWDDVGSFGNDVHWPNLKENVHLTIVLRFAVNFTLTVSASGFSWTMRKLLENLLISCCIDCQCCLRDESQKQWLIAIETAVPSTRIACSILESEHKRTFVERQEPLIRLI